MTWRDVTYAETVGNTGDYRGEPRIIYRCTLECGHWAQITAMRPPSTLRCDVCQRAGRTPIQLSLFKFSAGGDRAEIMSERVWVPYLGREILADGVGLYHVAETPDGTKKYAIVTMNLWSKQYVAVRWFEDNNQAVDLYRAVAKREITFAELIEWGGPDEGSRET